MSIEVFEIRGRFVIKNSKGLADMIKTLINLGIGIQDIELIPDKKPKLGNDAQ